MTVTDIPVDEVEGIPGDPFELAAGEVLTVDIDRSFASLHYYQNRQGGVYRIESDLPVAAFQVHAPAGCDDAASSLLLPDHAAAADHVSYTHTRADSNTYVSHLTLVGLSEETTRVSWTAPALEGASVDIYLDLHEVYLLTGGASDTKSDGDASGIVVNADRPIWAMGACGGATVPTAPEGSVDSLQEVLLPLSSWGTTYVGAPAPARSREDQIWRVFAGADDVTVTVEPPVDGTPATLESIGAFVELVVDHGQALIFTGDGPILPVQYLASNSPTTGGHGDAAMVAAIPVERFTTRAPLAVDTRFDNSLQIIRPRGAAAVRVDGEAVTGFVPVGAYEYANHPLAEGGDAGGQVAVHVVEGADPFGVTVFGYGPSAAYAHPGGLSLGTAR